MRPSLSREQREVVGTSTVFFGHQSVGRDLLAGVRELLPELPVAVLADSVGVSGPALLEASIGRNGDTRSKDRAFLQAVARLDPGSFALYKYCYADMDSQTNPYSLLVRYTETLQRGSHRGVRVVAVTMPLTTVEPLWKHWIKNLLGRAGARDLNARRQRFNEGLRAWATETPLIDLARMESTATDETRCLVDVEGRAVEVLADEFTDDGAHLNEHGRRVLAARFLVRLAQVISD